MLPTIEHDGTHAAFETAAGFVEIETGDGVLFVKTERQGTWELGISRAGLFRAHALTLRDLGFGATEVDDDGPFIATIREALRVAASAVQREIERDVAAFGRTPLPLGRGFGQEEHLCADAARFRPCRIAIAHLDRAEGDVGTDPDSPPDETPEGAEALIERLRNWRALFSRDQAVSRALNVTLTRYGDTAPELMLWGLGGVKLSRPVQSMRHLDVIAHVGSHPNALLMDGQVRLVEHATEAQLIEACGQVDPALLELPVDVSPEHALAELLALLDVDPDVPLDFYSFKQAVADARAILLRDARSTTPVKLPPIPLPQTPGVRFLATFGDFRREGREMNNCVAARRIAAASGEAYVFHVDGPDGPATVQVDGDGKVVEANGRGNVRNATVQLAWRALTAWGRGFWVRGFDLGADTRVFTATEIDPAHMLQNVHRCFNVYLRMCRHWADDDGRLAAWFATFVDLAVKGKVALICVDEEPRVRALAKDGTVLDDTDQIVSARAARADAARR